MASPASPTSGDQAVWHLRLRGRLRRTPLLTVAAGGAVAALLLGACGGSSPSTAPTTAPTAPSTSVAGGPATGSTSSSPPTSAVAPSTSAPPAPSVQCSTARLSAGLSEPNGTAGSVDFTLELYNTGATPCTLRGYPGVSFVAGADGHQVGAAATRLISSTPVVTLAPGKGAEALVRVVDAGNFPSACKMTSVLGFRVYPPGSTTSLFVPRSDQACAAPAYATLSVGPLHAP